jgi:flagellar basal-body rod protein FlgF
MDRVIYVAMTGAREAMRSQSASSHNIANVGTTGFKAVQNLLASAPILGGGLPTRVNSIAVPDGWNMQQGELTRTGRDLDVAIQGEGWLAVQDADGNEAYTRAGNLRVNATGLLETASGQLVLGSGGPISVPAYESLFVGSDGVISVVGQGQGAESLAEVDRLRLVNPPAADLVAKGNNLFALKDEGTSPPDVNVRVANGVLESSNVNATASLVDMIELSRSYEMQVRAMNTAEKNDAAAARLLRITG